MGQNNKVADGLSWLLNVSSCVIIVFVNKVLMDDKKGYRFVYSTTLCAFHYLSCSLSMWMAQFCGAADSSNLPWKARILFAVVANVSIASLNLSLLVNTVGFYQIAKLLVVPFVCFVEVLLYKRTFTMPTVLSILVVVAGVGIVTVTDMQSNILGVVVAGISVVSSGMQQILCGKLQRDHKVSSHQLLYQTAPLQGFMLLAVGPFLDHAVSYRWVFNFEYDIPAVGFLLLSCAIAVLVNISQFICLGRFSAVTFQVLGHTKTILVLLIGWKGLGEVMTTRKATGMTLAVIGMMMYGYFTSQQTQAKVQHSKKLEEKEPLIDQAEKGEVSSSPKRSGGGAAKDAD